MAKTQLNGYRRLLEAKRASLEQELGQALRDRERLAAVRPPDEGEAAVLTVEREVTAGNIDRLSRLLRQVKAALGRLGDGSYGACLRCDRDISAARLKAVPWAEYCVPCQEAVDEERRRAEETVTGK